jgi:hypothetical protein
VLVWRVPEDRDVPRRLRLVVVRRPPRYGALGHRQRGHLAERNAGHPPAHGDGRARSLRHGAPPVSAGGGCGSAGAGGRPAIGVARCRAVCMHGAQARPDLGRGLLGWPTTVPVLVTVDPFALLSSPLLISLQRTGHMRRVPLGANLSNDRLLVSGQDSGVSVHDERHSHIVRETALLNVGRREMPRLPSASNRLLRHADIEQLGATDDEIQARLIGQSLRALGVWHGWQGQDSLNQWRHHAPRHSVTARRNRRTIRLLRLRSSALAQSASWAWRSGGTRTKNLTTASAMTSVYTVLPPCNHDSTVLPCDVVARCYHGDAPSNGRGDVHS